MQTSRYVSSPSKKSIQKEKNDDQVLSSVNVSKKKKCSVNIFSKK